MDLEAGRLEPYCDALAHVAGTGDTDVFNLHVVLLWRWRQRGPRGEGVHRVSR
jgi:hypothetical protein